MNLKQRFSLLFSLLFSGILGMVMLLVYSLFAQFRTEEFKDRLEEKARTTIRLLSVVKEVDNRLLKIIDKNTINELYNEKTIIFNEKLEVVYSSIDDAPLTWTKGELQKIKEEKSTLKRNGEYEVYGMFYDSKYKDYYALVSAEDKYGNNKIKFLKYLLASAFALGTLVVSFLSFYVSKKSLRPLDNFRNEILDITGKNLNKRLRENNKNDEIDTLSKAFNQMLERIDVSYSRQREFTSNASHELRTPIARIVTQLENIIQDKWTRPETASVLASISEDCYQLSDIVTSLLILSQIDNNARVKGFKKIRLDEIIFYAEEELRKFHPNFKFHFEIEATSDDLDIEVMGDETLLRIAFTNVLKNGYHYSSNGVVRCTLISGAEVIAVHVVNEGQVPDIADTSLLFNTFTRGSNAQNKTGSGLGLSIVKHILDYHNAVVEYKIPDANTNELVISFSSHSSFVR
jgi:two-component system sensor histidine kinase ArlS